ncbi:flavin reductase family protein [Streptomyces albireticuli]|uniref:Flavin reductase n=1 Tax=Streptomyces albireticuli TaxID=1940 RepID=A0A2A2D2Q2_9ACTN|nr:flavin reductase family protein [Streptomyces albireticuli]PAU45696.1 flavin reductase [Streptomyces albireticuli]
MAVDAARFRALFGSFPTAVTVVTATDANGRPRGLTCNAVSAVSVEPPLLLVCVHRNARTLAALRYSGAFVVNVLADGGQDTARVFADRSAHKFAGVEWVPSAHARGAPVLVDVALAHAECVVVRAVEAGDHWIFIGRVEHAESYPRPPVLYHRGAFTVWDAQARQVGSPP